MRYVFLALMLAMGGQAGIAGVAFETDCAPGSMEASEGDPEREREMLKARLQSRLAEAQQLQERIESAMRRLDEGASAADVRAELEMPGEHRDMRRPGGLPGWREGRQRLNDEEREAAMAYAQQHAPDLARRYAALREEHASLADRMLARTEVRLRLFVAEHDERMRELRMREVQASWDVLDATRAFAGAMRSDAEEAQVRELGMELRKQLRQHFDLRQKIHQREIELLEERLADLRQEMEEHLAKRDEFVERRVEGVRRAVRQRGQSEDGSEGK